MEIGLVSFFNVERGFGKILTQGHPEGVFVHYTDVIGEAKILVENELVEFWVTDTEKGPKAQEVSRITDRLKGTIIQFDKGYGYVKEQHTGQLFFLHHTDVRGNGFKKIESHFEVEFSPFESERGLQAKEVIISDTRYPLERFAYLGEFDRHIESLAKIAQPENWDYVSAPIGNYPVLVSYLQYTFKRLEEEGKIEFTTDSDGVKYACINTGLITEKKEDIFGYFVENQWTSRTNGYLKYPAWVLKCFERESFRLMSYFPKRPQLAQYIENPADLVYDYSRRLIPDYEHIIGEREDRFPEIVKTWGKAELIARLRNAILLAERMIRRNYQTAVPQYYEGNIQLLLPLCLQTPEKADMALVVSKEHEIYRANTVIPLDWAYQNARLLAPPNQSWLKF